MAQSQRSYFLKSGALSILDKGSAFVFGFGSIYFITRLLERDDFKVWILFYTLISFLEVSRIGLQQNALVKYLSTAKADEEGLISSASFLLNIFITSITVGIILVTATPLAKFYGDPVLRDILMVYCLTSILMIPLHQFNFIQQAKLNFSGIFLSNFVQKGALFIYVGFVYFSNKDLHLMDMAWVQVLGAAMASIVSYIFAKPYLRFDWVFSRKWLFTLFNFGRFVFGTNLGTMLYKNIDKLMIGRMAGTSLPFYEWAIKITNLVEVPTFSIASIVFPQSARTMATEGKPGMKKLYERSVGSILALILPFMFVVFIFAEPIIVFLATEQYIEAVPILRLTLFYGIFIPFAVQFGTILDSMGQPKINFRFTVLGAIINIILNYVFINKFGVIGAAYGTLISYSIIFISSQILLYNIIGSNPLNVFKYIIPFYRDGLQLVQNQWAKQTLNLKNE